MTIPIATISFLSTLLIAVLVHLLTSRREREKAITGDLKGLDKMLSEVQTRLSVIESEIRYITENLVFRTTKASKDVDSAHEKIRQLETLQEGK